MARGSFWKPVLTAAAVAIVVGGLGGTLTDTGIWYQSLVKPSWQPPDWLFGPAWTMIFALATVSAVYAWRNADNRAQREWVVGLFALNGFLNLLWSLLFFALRRAGLGAGRGPVALAVDPAADRCVLALCETREPLSTAVSALGVLRRVSQSDGRSLERAFFITARSVAPRSPAWEGYGWLSCSRADALSI